MTPSGCCATADTGAETLTSAATDSRAQRSIDELDIAICRLARNLNAKTYRMLVLVREFDERFGWTKWASRIAPSGSRGAAACRCRRRARKCARRMRCASLPAISAAFADGRLSYSKVRALTRAAHVHDEDLLLAYALAGDGGAGRGALPADSQLVPDSADAREAWERRSLSYAASAARSMAKISVELPLEEGELIARGSRPRGRSR